MGRSGASSCFKLITCGGDPADKDDDLHLPPSSPSPAEGKGSSDKRGWSFRKRSVRHRVLSNTVASDNVLPPANKEVPEPVEPSFTNLDTSAVAEKVSIDEEKKRLSVDAEPNLPESGVVDSQPEEYVVIVIQAAARGFLARREFQKVRNVVKLQAAVRGHMVRQHAVGTLRCIQAIVRMQALVRARHIRLSNENESHGQPGKAPPMLQGKERTYPVYVSIDKLLSNRFARQLIESSPKGKPINIKCDSSKPNSGWNWLERWMSVSSAEPTPKPESSSEDLARAKVEVIAPEVEVSVSAAEICEPAVLESGSKEVVSASESAESLITYEAENLKSGGIPLTSLVGGLSEESETLITKNSDNQEELPEVNLDIMSGSALHDHKPVVEQHDQAKRPMKRSASDELETEGKKHVLGSRKASNPSFIAAQSKFEEISSASGLNRSSSQDFEVEPNVDAVSSGLETETGAMEVDIIESALSHNSVHRRGVSGCGTELSITSTLDSPDRLDVGVIDPEQDAKIAGEEASNTVMEDSSPGKIDVGQGESTNLTVTAESLQEEVKPEINSSDEQGATEVETPSAYKQQSPEASPGSHVTVTESQGTPSSQVSVKAKKNNSHKSRSIHKHKPLSAGKRSPLHPSNDAGAARSSVEQEYTEEQNGKRRNSFGSPRQDQRDEDPRDSNSSGSLPRFMQATQSARAKMNTSNSPRSSPDVQDREYMKKRHSLPAANGRHGSPHIQRSLSQAQPGAKVNGVYVAREKKWQR